MLLSKQQKSIVEILKQLKYLRVKQLHALVRAEFLPQGVDITEHRLDVMLRQLRTGTSYVQLSSDIVTYGAREPDPRYLEAIDVMLELTESRPSVYSASRLQEPVLLRFMGSGSQNTGLFSVAWLDRPSRLSEISRMRGERIVWISGTINAAALGLLPKHHFFAARQKDGAHRFYGSQGP